MFVVIVGMDGWMDGWMEDDDYYRTLLTIVGKRTYRYVKERGNRLPGCSVPHDRFE